MKRLFLWSFTLLMVFGAALRASAAEPVISQDVPTTKYWVKVNVENPGSVNFYTDANKTKPLTEADDKGTFYFGYDTSTYLYVFPSTGYALFKINEPGVTNPKTTFANSYSTGEQFYSKMMGASHSGKELTIEAKQLVYDCTLEVNVINGADKLVGKLTPLGTGVSFKDGKQSVKFSSEFEKNIQITSINNSLKEFYSIKLNGVDLSNTSKFNANYTTAIKDGDNLEIQVNEESYVEEYVTIAIEYPENFEGCINNIRNRTNNTWVEIENGKITVLKDSELQFNFIAEGYDFTGFTLNGVSIWDNYTVSSSTGISKSLKFTATEDATLKIEGKAAVYEKIKMTAYILNAEGVKIKSGKNADNDNFIDMSPAKAITQDITLPTQTHTDTEGNVTYITPSYTLTPENAKMIEFTVEDRQYYNAYVYPADGWYIATVQAKEGSSFSEIPYADKAYNTTIYIVALPLANDATATVDVTMSDAEFNTFVFKANDVLVGSWNNPESSYKINNGTNTIKFTEGYQTPFEAATKQINPSLHAVVDGLVLPLADAETATKYTIDPINGSKVLIGTDKIEAYKFELTSTSTARAAAAEVTYSPLNRIGTASMNLLAGTPVTIKPAGDDCMITVNGKIVYSPKNNINLLTDGAYSFTVTEAVSASVSDDAALVEITKTRPIEGQVVAELEDYTVYMPALDNGNIFYCGENFGQIKVTSASGKTIEATAIEPSMDETTGATTFLITFEAIDAAGNYTVTIPEGFFFEARFNDSYEIEAVAGGSRNKAFTGSFSIDPNAPAYHLVPAAGSKVNSLNRFEIVFADASGVEYIDDTKITLKGDNFSTTTTFVSTVTGRDFATYAIEFATTPSVAGDYTLEIPAGAFSIDGWKESVACTANYTYVPVYNLIPASGSTIEQLEFTIEFPDAKEVTLEGSRYDIHLFAGETYAAPGMNIEKVADADVPTFKISLDAEAQRPPFGQLSLSIDEGVFTIDGSSSPYITASYTYEGTVSADYKCDPSGTKMLLPSDQWGMVMWTFIFDESATVGTVDDLDAKATVTINGTDKRNIMAMTEVNMLMMALESKDGLKDGDVLRVQIPAGAFTISGEASPAIDRSWTLVAEKDYTYEADPASGSTIRELNEITITFPEATSGIVNEDSHFADIKQGYGVVGKMDITYIGEGKFKLTAQSPITTAGTYTININAYSILLDEVATYPGTISLTYTVDPSLTGIDEIIADGNGKVTVVTIDGRVIIKDADPAEISKLSTGIYIINGHKTAIRK